MLKNARQLIWISIGLGWVFDLLFWGNPFGVSFAIYVLVTIAAGFAIAWREKIRPARAALWLLLPIAFFSIMSVVRVEPFTTFLNRSLSLALMMILASSFTGGRWFGYQLRDYAVGLGSLVISALSIGARYLGNWLNKSEADHPEDSASANKAAPIIRGILLSLPLMLFFGALLSSADPIFSRYFRDLLELFKLDSLPEYIIRTIFIAIIAYFLVGVFSHIVQKSNDSKLATGKHQIEPFLGFVEASIILGSVITMFGAFVTIQVSYFFGGETNISIAGYTYSEYARRGFFELMVVALFTLMLFTFISAISNREESRQKKIFSGFGIALVALVAVILYSAFERLTILEQAFGFTRLRTYSHVFMIWVGVLLAAVPILEVLQRQRAFVFASLMAVLGFTVSLNLLNVDQFIAHQNISRYNQFEESGSDSSSRSRAFAVDTDYLVSLSTDAVPAMSALLMQAQAAGDDALLDVAGRSLACHAERQNNYLFGKDFTWQSFTFSHLKASQVWEDQAKRVLLSNQISCLSNR